MEKIKPYKRLEEQEKEMFKGEDFYDRLASDPTAMSEIEMYIDNTSAIYNRSFLPMVQNLKRKIKAGKYNHALAPKLWLYLVEAGMKGYAKEFGDTWNTLLSTKDRKVLAQKYADFVYDAIVRGEYN
jgi:hypothetical protein